MKPYWQSASGDVTVYCARFEDVLAAGVVDVPRVALVHDDPTYGNGDHAHRPGQVAGRIRRNTKGTARSNGAENGRAREYPALPGNDRPFDPAPLLALDRPLVLWGGNHYASRLPDSTAWIFWDKRDGTEPDDGSDGELAWTNLGGALRTFRHVWRGLCRASETGTPHLHPTQKPIALCSYVYQRAKLTRGDLVFVPHGGSGPDLPASRAAGLRLIWCDVESWCCDTAISRLGAVTAARAAEPVGPLFARLP